MSTIVNCQSINVFEDVSHRNPSTKGFEQLHVKPTWGEKMNQSLCERCMWDLSNTDTDSMLYTAVEKRHCECVNVLIETGADVNGNNNKQGNNVLIYTCVKTDLPEDLQYIQCVSMLLAAGADVNLVNCNQYSALMYYSREGYVECVNLLIKAGAYVNMRNKHGESALSLAALGDQSRCMRVLIEAGADVNNRNTRGGETVLHWAIWDIDCLKMLLKSSVRINQHDANFLNALQRYLQRPRDVIKENAMLLYAAGENTDGSIVKITRGAHLIGANGITLNGRRKKLVSIPEYLLNLEPEPCLQSLCRETIRKHLMRIDPHGNLFSRVPFLGLPSALCRYLLYYMSVDDQQREADKDIL